MWTAIAVVAAIAVAAASLYVDWRSRRRQEFREVEESIMARKPSKTAVETPSKPAKEKLQVEPAASPDSVEKHVSDLVAEAAPVIEEKTPVKTAPVPTAKVVMERYDGPFPAGMFVDLDDPQHIWHGDHWKNGDVVRDPLRGQRLGGKPGTKFEGCVYNWDGCFWERPVK
jgi:hypothetical protein